MLPGDERLRPHQGDPADVEPPDHPADREDGHDRQGRRARVRRRRLRDEAVRDARSSSRGCARCSAACIATTTTRRASIASVRSRSVRTRVSCASTTSRVSLTKTEFRLLVTLAAKPGRVFSREQLLHRGVGLRLLRRRASRRRPHQASAREDRGRPARPEDRPDGARDGLQGLGGRRWFRLPVAPVPASRPPSSSGRCVVSGLVAGATYYLVRRQLIATNVSTRRASELQRGCAAEATSTSSSAPRTRTDPSRPPTSAHLLAANAAGDHRPRRRRRRSSSPRLRRGRRPDDLREVGAGRRGRVRVDSASVAARSSAARRIPERRGTPRSTSPTRSRARRPDARRSCADLPRGDRRLPRSRPARSGCVWPRRRSVPCVSPPKRRAGSPTATSRRVSTCRGEDELGRLAECVQPDDRTRSRSASRESAGSSPTSRTSCARRSRR